MIKLSSQKIRDSLLANQFLRRIKIFFHKSLFPALFSLFIALLMLILLSGVTLKIFKPDYLQKIYQKSTFYFFHYLRLDNKQFSKINISGNKRISESEVIRVISEVQKNSAKDTKNDYQPLIPSFIKKIKTELPWVDQVMISRSLPNVLNITIAEYEPFAIWQKNNKKYLTDKKGNLIETENLDEFRNMVILSGDGANIHAESLFNIFTIDPALGSKVYSATWVGNRRWDIRFESGLLIKLPESNINNAWQNLIKIYNMPGSILGLKVIDLRLRDKIYLEYEDEVIKELRAL